MDAFLTEFERQRLAGDPSTAPDVLATLALDEYVLIRGSVALNPSTIPSVLAILATDSHWLVRCYAAQHVNLPLECLILLSHDDAFQVRAWVARLSMSPETLFLLAKDAHKQVRWDVAANLKSPYGIWLDGFGRILP